MSELHDHHHIDRTFDQRFMLVFTLEGCSHFDIDGFRGDMTAGSLLFVPANTRFQFNLGPEKYRKSVWVIVDCMPFWTDIEQRPWRVPCRENEQIARCLENLYAEQQHPSNSRLRELQIETLSCYLHRVLCRKAPESYDPRLEQLLRQVNESLQRKWSICELCEHANLSRAQLHRLFKEHYHCSPAELITRIRLNMAEYMLCVKQSSIAEAAYAAGYNDPFYFSTVFKKYHGLSPSCYQKKRNTGQNTDSLITMRRRATDLLK
ncbi:helix-turn-helix transcriptional regulator [Corallincola luteus]|nr:AraC family transcriptional regulator [Corallincola luteus]